MKKLLVLLILFVALAGYSQTQTIRLNKSVDTVLSKETVDSAIQVVNSQQDTIAKKNRQISEFKKSIKENLWAGQSPVKAFWFAFWSGLGILLWWIFRVDHGIRKSEDSPAQFRIKYWWDHNRTHMIYALGVLLVIFIVYTFSNEILHLEASKYVALGVGFSFQAVIEIVLKKLQIKGNAD